MESETNRETRTYLKLLQARAESLHVLIESLEAYEKQFKEGKRNVTILEEIRETAEELRSTNDVFSEIIWTYNEKALKTPAQLAKEQEAARKEEENKSAAANIPDDSDDDDKMSTIE